MLVLIIDPSSQTVAATSILRDTFDLTAAEARVALLVAQGLSGPRAAMALGVSLDTVKTHLARCFDKMGVHSQVMIARIVSALPNGFR
jgi:DNA-binding CsgD family transcriptional regulator